ncbi:DUF2279 domain-containing protein [Flaviaesturariibacter flavus]|uniref:DUF2279 domain-containing protein n=1 Tax=Flaviaesturariibacter flavus TaxID=2502780 RepID=UPI001404DED6|nr:DUF2279 domain-containing protein [Flaviaesturariibacter flavus]
MKKLCIVIFSFLFLGAAAQDTPALKPIVVARPDNFRKATAAAMVSAKPVTDGFGRRKVLVDGMAVGIYGGMLAWLNGAWYKDYEHSAFHTFNDIGEWQQMDKVGHAWSVYSMSHIGYGLWRWSGYSNKKATLLAAGSGLAFMLGVEYLDGRSAEWGWSWGDAGADLFGAALFATQQLCWGEQKFRLKFSAHPRSYGPELAPRARQLFGSSLQNKLLKDYNTQTYWLSFPLPAAWKLPKWLRISVGYGADGMFGGYENRDKDANGNVSFSRPDIKRFRQWYLAPDIDLTQIPTKSKLLRSVFYSINILKFPAPSLEFSNGSFKGHLLHF